MLTLSMHGALSSNHDSLINWSTRRAMHYSLKQRRTSLFAQKYACCEPQYKHGPAVSIESLGHRLSDNEVGLLVVANTNVAHYMCFRWLDHWTYGFGLIRIRGAQEVPSCQTI